MLKHQAHHLNATLSCRIMQGGLPAFVRPHDAPSKCLVKGLVVVVKDRLSELVVRICGIVPGTTESYCLTLCKRKDCKVIWRGASPLA